MSTAIPAPLSSGASAPPAPAREHAESHVRSTLFYRREIDGLRALAVLPVILFHGGIGAFSGGFVGVDVFFVISGYLITSILVAELASGSFTLRGFYERRARRILPALFLVMAATVPLALLWLMPGDLQRYGQSLVAVASLVSNFFFSLEAGSYFSNHVELQPLLHTWSLAVEEHYYLLFPLFLALAWRWGRRRIALSLGLLALTSLVGAELLNAHYPLVSFYLLPTRAWEIAAGALLVLLRPTPGLRESPSLAQHGGALLGLAMIVYAVFSFDQTTPFPGRWTLVPVVGAALVVTCATGRTLVGQVLGAKPLVGLGLISYSAYLWHQPLFAFARQRSFSAPDSTTMLALAALSLVLAAVSWRYVELPFRDRRRITGAQIFRFSVWGSVSFVCIGLAIVLCRGYPERLPAEALAVLYHAAATRAEQSDPKCNVAESNYHVPACVRGAAAPPRIVLLGDSHATVFAHELETALRQRGQSYVQITKNGCPVAFGFLKGGSDENCSRFQTAYLEKLADPTLDTVIVASRWAQFVAGQQYDNGEGGIGVDPRDPLTVAGIPLDAPLATRQAAILATYTSSIQRLLAMGKKVILVYPIPEQGWSPPAAKAKSLWFGYAPPHPFAVRVESFRERNAGVLRALDAVGEHPNLFRVRPDALLCDTVVPGRCATERDGELLYFDDSHLANAAARPLIDQFLPHLPAPQP